MMSPRSMHKHRKKQHWLLISSLSGSVMIGCALGLLAYLLSDIPSLQLSAFTELPAATLIFSSDQSLLGRFAALGDRRPLTSLDAAGKYLPQAFIAAEDKDFYRHKGIDVSAILRSAWGNMRHRAITSGASTITQQTVKLALFPRQQRTIRRKLQEIVLAMQLERYQTKQQILLEYLNAVYFGQMHGIPIYGIESAALHAFGQHAKDLTVAQAAFLAAIPNNPERYAIAHRSKQVTARQRWILTKMLDHRELSRSAFNKAIHDNIFGQLVVSPLLSSPYESLSPYIAVQVSRAAKTLIAQVEHTSEHTAQAELQSGGYRIYTSIDASMQNRVDQALSASDFPQPISYTYVDRLGQHTVMHADEQVGTVVVENRTGRILAIGGGRHFTTDEVDHTLIRRQPGSTLKPLIVYGPAIENRLLTAGTIIDDLPRHYYDPNASGEDWFPQNWDHQFHGLLTARDALMQSYNGPAIEVISHVGTRAAMHTARQLGLDGITQEDAQSLGLAIGGTAGGVSPTEMAAAYATLAQNGVYRSLSLIDRIENEAGQTIYRRPCASERIVFARGTTAILTTMLESVIQDPVGTAHVLKKSISTTDVAGKTGTTDDNRDAWFIGYTPNYTMSTWVGYDIPHPLINHGPFHETSRPIRIFAQVLGPIIIHHKSVFPLPAHYHKYLICTKSGQLAGPLCRAAHETEWDIFADDTAPTSVCSLHRLVLTTQHDGRKVLATDLTPVSEMKQEILLDRIPASLDPKDRYLTPRDHEESIPHESDPRGGYPLTD